MKETPEEETAGKRLAFKAKPARSAATKTAAVKPEADPAGADTPAMPAAPKPLKVKKPKLVRDSFTIPKDEYSTLDQLKQRAVGLAQAAKKSEVLRAGIKALSSMSDKDFLAALRAVPSIKTGRPKKA